MDERDGARFRLWFTDSQGIRSATSDDGTNWTIHPDPALSREGSLYYPTVLIDGAVYRMWYSAAFHPDDLVGQVSFGYATSTDGLTWTDHGEVFAKGRDAGRLTVLKEGAGYRGWFHSMPLSPPYEIFSATSPDGIHWTTSPTVPVLTASEAWEGDSVREPYVLRDGTRLRMGYIGNGIGMATSVP